MEFPLCSVCGGLNRKLPGGLDVKVQFCGTGCAGCEVSGKPVCKACVVKAELEVIALLRALAALGVPTSSVRFEPERA